ncbi:MAG: type II secretion system F family protein [Candidatus Aminicenantes bacterium]|nr:type II secretion system F family protein [Candidatus Aminicenantes bacterium]
MPNFYCRFLTPEGKLVRDVVRASSAKECRTRLEAEGFCVLSVRKEYRLKRIYIGRRKFKAQDFILFNQELIALLKAGYPVLKSLELVERRIENPVLKEIVQKVAAEVRAGKSLSEAFANFGNHFSRVYIASLMAGEKSGNLPGSIARYIQYARVIDQTRTRIRSALLYPTLLVLFSLVLIGLLVGLVLPRFAAFYADFSAQLPRLTIWLMVVANFVRDKILWFLGAFFIILVAIIFLRRKSGFLFWWEHLKIKLPVAGYLIQDSAVALFSRTLGLLLEAGISLLPAVEVAAQAVPNRYLMRQLETVIDSLKNGQSLHESLARTEVFPQLALDMVRIGENSANLPGMLAEVADFYDERLRDKIQILVSLIEPFIIIFIGLIAAAMILSIYLPIFNIIRITR